jgi:hypothetical protein
VYGSDQTFTTSSISPVVATSAASSITGAGATLNGDLTAVGSAASVNLSFEWGLTTSYGSTANGSPASLAAPGTFTANLTGLAALTEYHYRAKADGDAAGIVYGSDQTFTTASSGALTLYENYHATQDSTGVGLHAAQTFTPQTTHTVTSIKLRLWNNGATGSVTVSIRAVDGSGNPTGANLVTSAAVANSTIPAAWTTVQFNLESGYQLQAGTSYALQINSDTNGLYAAVDTTGSYSSGIYLSANDAQTYWNNHSGAWDIWFEDWGPL